MGAQPPLDGDVIESGSRRPAEETCGTSFKLFSQFHCTPPSTEGPPSPPCWQVSLPWPSHLSACHGTPVLKDQRHRPTPPRSLEKVPHLLYTQALYLPCCRGGRHWAPTSPSSHISNQQPQRIYRGGSQAQRGEGTFISGLCRIRAQERNFPQHHTTSQSLENLRFVKIWAKPPRPQFIQRSAARPWEWHFEE